MFKKAGIVLFLSAFVFQAFAFNFILLFCWHCSKIEAETVSPQAAIIIENYTPGKYGPSSEISLGNYLCDVHSVKQEGKRAIIVFSVDLKEKGILEKLADHFQKNRAKKELSLTSFYFRNEQAVVLPVPHPSGDQQFFSGNDHFTSLSPEQQAPPPKI